MTTKPLLKIDVLVIGAGIAGISAAIYAAKNGAKVALTSSANIFSGSTFYPGTWGFGLIGPEDEDDEENLLEAIRSIGQNMVIDEVVETFVKNLNPSIDALENLGITLEKPSQEAEGEKEYIPCFDTKHRRWRGLTKKNLLETLPQILKELKIIEIPFFEAVELIKEDGKVCGVLGMLNRTDAVSIRAKAVVMATGGSGGVYKYRLTTDDVTGAGLGMALRVGARLVNLEFMQIMLGFVRPAFKTIYNEKTFFASRFYNSEGKEFLQTRLLEGVSLEDVLKERSRHGPFSSRTISKFVDIGIFDEINEGKAQGVIVKVDEEYLNTGSEFVREYFTWLKEEKHVDIKDEILVAPFMHASNGGIEIDKKARTTVEGLFACGEGTGGMHGADRIGGLSTANGIVFGKIAGENSARYARDAEAKRQVEIKNSEAEEIKVENQNPELREVRILHAMEKIRELQEEMYKDAFLIRSDESLKRASEHVESIELLTQEEGNLLESYRLLNDIILVKAILSVMDARKESRGSHYREDYPETNPRDFESIYGVRYEEEEKHLLSFIKQNPLLERWRGKEVISW